MFAGAVLLALPVMVSMLFINVGLGVVTKAAPSLNIFAVGFPAMLLAGLLILILSMDSTRPWPDVFVNDSPRQASRASMCLSSSMTTYWAGRALDGLEVAFDGRIHSSRRVLFSCHLEL